MLLNLHLQTESKGTVTNTRTQESSQQTVLVSLFAQLYPKGFSPMVTPLIPGLRVAVKDLEQPPGL